MKSEVLVPDIGDFEDVEVVEILVSAGDRVETEDSLITVESDKATLEIPSPHAGTVVELYVALGDRVSQGARILTLEADAAAPAPEVSEPAPRESGAETAQPASGRIEPEPPAPRTQPSAPPAGPAGNGPG